MNSLKGEKTPWTKFPKKPGPKKKEKGEYLSYESRRKKLEKKAYAFFGSRSVDWMFGSLEVATTLLFFR